MEKVYTIKQRTLEGLLRAEPKIKKVQRMLDRAGLTAKIIDGSHHVYTVTAPVGELEQVKKILGMVIWSDL